MIPELDIEQLEADLYTICQAIKNYDYGKADRKAWIAWGQVRRFRDSLNPSHLPATESHDPKGTT